MATVKARVKPELLIRAREEAGYQIEDAAKKIGQTPDRLLEWEQGTKRPTINQLRTMARVYKRPLSAFYLPEVPKRFRVMKDFRRLPGEVAGRYSPALRHEMRMAQQRRALALELFEDVDERPPPFELRATLEDDAEDLGLKIREVLEVTHAEQIAWREPRIGFNAWRTKIEFAGVLVFQGANIGMDDMRAFSIAEFPLQAIDINKKDPSFNSRTFSLLHELTHLMLHTSGLCDLAEDARRPPEEQKVEVFCNRVAGATLVPRDRLLRETIVADRGARPGVWADHELEALSKMFSVSREVVLRRLLTFGRTTDSFYRDKRAELLVHYEARRELEKEKQKNQDFRRNMPQEALSNYGAPFVRLVFDSYHQRRITLNDVSAYLGVGLRHLPKIEQRLGVS